jgi:hypothetical protein
MLMKLLGMQRKVAAPLKWIFLGKERLARWKIIFFFFWLRESCRIQFLLDWAVTGELVKI